MTNFDILLTFLLPLKTRQNTYFVYFNWLRRLIFTNKVVLMGRLTRDPEVRYSQGDNPVAVARYTLAVPRRYKRDGEPESDFINCIAFGKAGEFAEKYLKKATKICISGRIQTGNYTNKDGQKVYTTDVVVEEHEFTESKSSSQSQKDSYAPSDIGDGFMNVPDGIDEELPFN
jgi:single-strand DNA-binding protein